MLAPPQLLFPGSQLLLTSHLARTLDASAAGHTVKDGALGPPFAGRVAAAACKQLPAGTVPPVELYQRVLLSDGQILGLNWFDGVCDDAEGSGRHKASGHAVGEERSAAGDYPANTPRSCEACDTAVLPRPGCRHLVQLRTFHRSDVLRLVKACLSGDDW